MLHICVHCAGYTQQWRPSAVYVCVCVCVCVCVHVCVCICVYIG